MYILKSKFKLSGNLRINLTFKSHLSGSSMDQDIFKNKETYIMSKWCEDFPTHSGLTYSEVSSLSSRSRDISKWFSKASEEFVLYKEAPSWFLGSGAKASDWTSEIQDKYKYVKKLNLEYVKQVNQISNESRKKLVDLDSNHRQKLTALLSETPELVFELMNSQMLPFETHLKAFEYKSKEEAKAFISSELEIFKVNKYQDFINGTITSTDLVNLLFEK